MLLKSNLLSAIYILAATSSLARPVGESRDTCVILPLGNYTISSANNNWQLRPFHNLRSPPAINTLETPPAGELGVWEISSAPQNAYYMANVGEGYVVSTLIYGSITQPYTTLGVAPSPFAIQCAGDGTYTIKNPIADEVWTAPPGAFVQMIGANGEITQRFKFTKV